MLCTYRRTVHAIVTCKDLKDALAEKSVKISIMNFVNFGQKRACVCNLTAARNYRSIYIGSDYD